jgi:hypothetical protein
VVLLRSQEPRKNESGGRVTWRRSSVKKKGANELPRTANR